VQQGSDVELDE